MPGDGRTLGLYVHVPFCIRKCAYCDFLSIPDLSLTDAYMASLFAEIKEASGSYGHMPVDTVFLGGGTPSCLPPEKIRGILGCLRECFDILPDAEITMEMNPGAADGFPDDAGINRVSIGLQSAEQRLLTLLGRIHTADEAASVIRKMRGLVPDLNLDLMAGLPEQSCDDLLHTIRSAASFGPDHISCYSLIVEPGTPFFALYNEEDGTKKDHLPDEDSERETWHLAVRELERLGYRRYEISNFAKPGHESRHNLRYWKRQDYLGFGPGAASMAGEMRWENKRDIRAYCKDGAVREHITPLGRAQQMEETMFLGLRLTEGVADDTFRGRFGQSLDDVYGAVIEKHAAAGLLTFENGRLALTERGFDISNAVLADFLLDEEG